MRNENKELRIRNSELLKLVALGLTIIIGGLIITKPSHAVETTPSPKPEEQTAPSPGVKGVDDVRKKVQEIVQEKIAQLKLGQKVGYFGTITNMEASIITIKTDNAEIKAEVTADTKYAGPKKQSSLADIKVGDNIIAMGYVKDEGIITAARIVVFEKPKAPAKAVAFGRVSDISSDEKVITVKNEKKQISYTIEFSSTTVITKKINGRVQKTTFDKIAKGDMIVAVGTPSLNNDKLIVAKIVHVIPGLSKPSPSVSPSPKPTKKPTATPTSAQ